MLPFLLSVQLASVLVPVIYLVLSKLKYKLCKPHQIKWSCQYYLLNLIFLAFLAMLFISPAPYWFLFQFPWNTPLCFSLICSFIITFHLFIQSFECRYKEVQKIKSIVKLSFLSVIGLCIFFQYLVSGLFNLIHSDYQSIQEVRLSILYLILPPYSLILGTLLMGCFIHFRNTFLIYAPAIALLLALLVSVEAQRFDTAVRILILYLTLFGIAFTSLFYILKQSQTHCLCLTGTLYLLFTIPYLILGILFSNYYKYSNIYYEWLFLFSAFLIFLILVSRNSRFFCQSRKRKLCALSSNYSEAGHLVNTCSFLFGEGLLCYTQWNNKITSHLTLGFIFACCVALLLLFTVINLTLSLGSFIPQGDRDSTYFDYALKQSFQNLSEQDEVGVRRDPIRASKLQVAIILIVLIAIPAGSIPLGLILADWAVVQYALVLSGIFSAIIGIIGIIALEVKKYLGPYSNNGLPICLSMVWILIGIPFCIVLPFAIFYSKGTEYEFEVLVTVGFFQMILVFLVGTTYLSSILNQVFQKMQKELTAKLTIKYATQILRDIAVKGEAMPLRLCVQSYMNKGRVALVEDLENDRILMAWELGELDPNPSISKVIVTVQFYEKARKKREKLEKNISYLQLKMENKFQKAIQKLKKKGETKKQKRIKKKTIGNKITRPSFNRPARSIVSTAFTEEEKNQRVILNSFDRNSLQEDSNFMFQNQRPSLHQRTSYLRRSRVNQENQKDNHDLDESSHSISIFLSQQSKNESMSSEILRENEREARMQECYVIANSTLQQPEQKLIAVFELLQDTTNLIIALRLLLGISPKALSAFQNEIFAFYVNGEDSTLSLKEQLENIFLILQIRTPVENYLDEGGISEQDWNQIIQIESQKFYPAYAGAARKIFLKTHVLERLWEIGEEFINHALAVYLMNVVKPEVEAIRERRIQEQLGVQNTEKKDKRRGGITLTKCQALRNKCCSCKTDKLKRFVLEVVLCCCFSKSYLKVKDLRDPEDIDQEITKAEIEHLRPSKQKLLGKIEHEQSPDWEELKEVIPNIIGECIQRYDEKKRLPWKCTSSNAIMLIIKLLELLTFLAFIWSRHWGVSKNVQTILKWIIGELPLFQNSYIYLYGVSLFLALSYNVLVKKAAAKMRDDSLGNNGNGLRTRCCSCSILFVKLVQLVSVYFYTFIIKNLLDAFSCDFSHHPSVLHRYSQITCFSWGHFAMMGLALVGILAYYPFATFLYSNLQFVNKVTDLKFHPQFVVYLAQVKLIFSALSSFLPSQDNVFIMQLAVMSAFMFLIAMHSVRKTPCLVQSVNHIFSISYFTLSYLMLTTILVVLQIQLLVVVIVMGAGTLLIWIGMSMALCFKPIYT